MVDNSNNNTETSQEKYERLYNDLKQTLKHNSTNRINNNGIHEPTSADSQKAADLYKQLISAIRNLSSTEDKKNALEQLKHLNFSKGLANSEKEEINKQMVNLDADINKESQNEKKQQRKDNNEKKRSDDLVDKFNNVNKGNTTMNSNNSNRNSPEFQKYEDNAKELITNLKTDNAFKEDKTKEALNNLLSSLENISNSVELNNAISLLATLRTKIDPNAPVLSQIDDKITAGKQKITDLENNSNGGQGNGTQGSSTQGNGTQGNNTQGNGTQGNGGKGNGGQGNGGQGNGGQAPVSAEMLAFQANFNTLVDAIKKDTNFSDKSTLDSLSATIKSLENVNDPNEIQVASNFLNQIRDKISDTNSGSSIARDTISHAISDAGIKSQTFFKSNELIAELNDATQTATSPELKQFLTNMSTQLDDVKKDPKFNDTNTLTSFNKLIEDFNKVSEPDDLNVAIKFLGKYGANIHATSSNIASVHNSIRKSMVAQMANADRDFLNEVYPIDDPEILNNYIKTISNPITPDRIENALSLPNREDRLNALGTLDNIVIASKYISDKYTGQPQEAEFDLILEHMMSTLDPKDITPANAASLLALTEKLKKSRYYDLYRRNIAEALRQYDAEKFNKLSNEELDKNYRALQDDMKDMKAPDKLGKYSFTDDKNSPLSTEADKEIRKDIMLSIKESVALNLAGKTFKDNAEKQAEIKKAMDQEIEKFFIHPSDKKTFTENEVIGRLVAHDNERQTYLCRITQKFHDTPLVKNVSQRLDSIDQKFHKKYGEKWDTTKKYLGACTKAIPQVAKSVGMFAIAGSLGPTLAGPAVAGLVAYNSFKQWKSLSKELKRPELSFKQKFALVAGGALTTAISVAATSSGLDGLVPDSSTLQSVVNISNSLGIGGRVTVSTVANAIPNFIERRDIKKQQAKIDKKIQELNKLTPEQVAAKKAARDAKIADLQREMKNIDQSNVIKKIFNFRKKKIKKELYALQTEPATVDEAIKLKQQLNQRLENIHIKTATTLFSTGFGLGASEALRDISLSELADKARDTVQNLTDDNVVETSAETKMPQANAKTVAGQEYAEASTDNDNLQESSSTEKPDTEANDKADSKGESKADGKGESKADDKSDSKADDKGESKADGKGDSKADDKGESKTDGKGETKLTPEQKAAQNLEEAKNANSGIKGKTVLDHTKLHLDTLGDPRINSADMANNLAEQLGDKANLGTIACKMAPYALQEALQLDLPEGQNPTTHNMLQYISEHGIPEGKEAVFDKFLDDNFEKTRFKTENFDDWNAPKPTQQNTSEQGPARVVHKTPDIAPKPNGNGYSFSHDVPDYVLNDLQRNHQPQNYDTAPQPQNYDTVPQSQNHDTVYADIPHPMDAFARRMGYDYLEPAPYRINSEINHLKYEGAYLAVRDGVVVDAVFVPHDQLLDKIETIPMRTLGESMDCHTGPFSTKSEYHHASQTIYADVGYGVRDLYGNGCIGHANEGFNKAMTAINTIGGVTNDVVYTAGGIVSSVESIKNQIDFAKDVFRKGR